MARFFALPHGPRLARTRESVGAVALLPLAVAGVGVGWAVLNELLDSNVRAFTGIPAVVDELILVALATATVLLVQLRRWKAEARLRLFLERSQDVVYRYRLGESRGIEFISPSVERLTGRPAADFLADPALGASFVDPELAAPDPRAPGEHRVTSFRRPDGSLVYAEYTSVRVTDRHGQVVAVEGVARDVTHRIVIAEALRTPERTMRELLDGVELAAVTMTTDGIVTYANPASLRLLGRTAEGLVGLDWVEVSVPPARRAEVRRVLSRVASDERVPAQQEAEILAADGSSILMVFSNAVLRDDAGTATGLAIIGHDAGRQRERELEHERLAAAVESVQSSIMIIGVDGTIRYVNPAFASWTGYDGAEVVGRRPWDVFVSDESPTFWPWMAQALQRSGSWSGEWSIRRKDGRPLREEVRISPIHDGAGSAFEWVVVTRDVTREREIEASLAREIRERATVSAALERLQPAESAEATAAAICSEIFAVDGLDHAAIIEFRGAGEAVVLARLGGPSWPVEPGGLLPASRASYLLEHAERGAWAERWTARPEDGDYGREGAASGIKACAYAPIRNGDGTLGVLLLGTHDETRIDWMLRQTGVAVEFAATASALLAGWLETERRAVRAHDALAAAIAARAFHPVFQPIVDLADGRVVGYEALTRFDDDQPPDGWFRHAWTVGLGRELEEATLHAAIEAARRLPAGRWLDLNVSPRLVLEATEGLRALLATADRPLVLEITEHDHIDDYGELRERLGTLGTGIRVAVDDAGAGAANFGHIVELHPDLVKLDTGLVRAVNSDLGRQALVVAMRHFSRSTGCRLVAEGVETRAEAETLADLGIDFGQGFWYGRPDTAAAIALDDLADRGGDAAERGGDPAGRDALDRGSNELPTSGITLNLSGPEPV